MYKLSKAVLIFNVVFPFQILKFEFLSFQEYEASVINKVKIK